MKPERWERLQEIFQAALARDSGQIHSYVRQACNGDEELRQEVEALLEAHDDRGFLGSWASEVAEQLLEERLALRPGERLGPYEIEAHVATGGMGMVFRARDTRLHRTVAIKILRPVPGLDDLLAHIRREARSIARLQHPNICSLFDIGLDNGRDYIVMEYIEGHTLAERLRSGPIPADESLRYAIEIAAAIEHAHRRDVIHRDLKPANIILTKTGVKLLDFGLASCLKGFETVSGAEPDAHNTTSTGSRFGTLAYMAPEQIRGEPADRRTDLFAFGLVAYEMLAGRPAFDRSDSQALVRAIQDEQPLPLSDARTDVPPALERAIDVCLVKDRDDRWQDAGDLKRELIWIAAGGAGPVLPARPRWRAVMSAAALACMLAAGWGGYLMRRQPAARPFRIFLSPPPGGSYDTRAGFALSPDGTRIALSVTDGAGKRMLWVRALDMPTAQLVLGTEGARYPFWSPDGRFIAFFAGGLLKKMDSGGGAVEQIAEAPNPVGGVWGPDNTILFVPDRFGPVQRLSLSDGHSVAVSLLDATSGDYGHGWPAFLPDGRHFLFVAFSNQRMPTLYAGSVDSKRAQRLTMAGRAVFRAGALLLYDGDLHTQPFDDRGLRLKGEATVVARAVESATGFDAAANGTIAFRVRNIAPHRELVWLDRTGKPLGSKFSPDRYDGVSLSPDMRSAAVILPEAEVPHIWLYDASSQERSIFAPNSAFPTWSPDGKRIIYTDRNRGIGDIVMRSIRLAGAEETLVTAATAIAPYSWSADGRYLTYTELDQGSAPKYSVWLYSFLNRSPLAFLKGGRSNSQAVLSPDGRWIAYWSDETPPAQVFVARFPDGAQKRRVSIAGGQWPEWRKDGRELYYVDAADRLTAVAIEKRGTELTIGEPRSLFEVSLSKWGKPYAVADGVRFLALRDVRIGESQPIVAILNGIAPAAK